MSRLRRNIGRVGGITPHVAACPGTVGSADRLSRQDAISLRGAGSALQKTQRGAGLIEVMIALLVLAIGLLGFAAMQTQGISQGQKAYLHSQAMFAAQDMVERMRANPAGLDSYSLSFSDSAPASANCRAGACAPAALAAWDKTQWLALLEESLPMGDGQIQMVSTGDPTLVLISIRYRLNRDLDVHDQSINKNMAAEYVYELRAQL